MKKIVLPMSTLGIVGAVSLGLLGVNAATAAGGTDAYVKREDKSSSLALVADDDDDDSNTGGNTGGDSRDGTNSQHTNVSRDRDRSRGDLTKDWTRDGGDRTRDFSQNLTNDGSRNDAMIRRNS